MFDPVRPNNDFPGPPYGRRRLSESMVTLRECGNGVEAETVRIRLADAGIRALITGTDAAAALSMGGAITDRLIRVEVAESDYASAATLLAEDARRLRDAEPWMCDRCHEQNEPAFDICWSCAKPVTDQDRRGRRSESAVDEGLFVAEAPTVRPAQGSSDNPYRPVLIPNEAIVISESDGESISANASRALRAAIVGAIVFPPLISFYSVYLLVRLRSQLLGADHSTRRRIAGAWLINLLTIPSWIFLWVSMV